jgi:hypothetical protein
MFHRAIALLAILGLCACSGGDADGSNAVVLAEFQEGQAWSYHTRRGEEDSILVIGRIEDLDGQRVVHIQVRGVSIPNRQGTSEVVGHLPISEAALRESVTALAVGRLDQDLFEEGYSEWRRARGGVFTVTVEELVDSLERLMR